jgi:UDP-glucuronate 4-epimerase
MRILVTGGAGFIGSHLSEKLQEVGHEVTALDSLSDFLYPSKIKEQNVQILQSKGIKFIHADLSFSNLEPIVKNQDVVINQAAIPGLAKSWSNIKEYTDSNVIGLGKLLDACIRTKTFKFIQISTSSVYGLKATGKEDSEKLPVSPYGVTKLAAENLAKAYAMNFGLNVTILRYYSVYGPRQRPDMAYNRFINAILNGTKIQVFGDGMQTRTNTFVSDVVDATISSMNLKKGPEEHVFNISGNESYSMQEIIHKIEMIVGKPAKIEYAPRVYGDQDQTLGDISMARKHLNWTPKVQINEGLEAQVKWQKDLEK